MQIIARYRAKGRDGRAHLINEFRDEGRRRWMELLDGTRIVQTVDRTLVTAAGESLILIGPA